jgi:anaphase-promoting complex subunit 2
LELLKLRFKEEELRDCEVMLADIIESKRINTNLHSLHPNVSLKHTLFYMTTAFNINAMILTRRYLFSALHSTESDPCERDDHISTLLAAN